jgi:hypothetical protein
MGLIKMADGKVCVEQSAPVLLSKVVVKENICECCNIIESELVELKSELKSCREIIRKLHEEVQVGKSTPHAAWDMTNRDRIEQTQINAWPQDGGWQNPSNGRRRPQRVRIQLQQLPLHTSNQFEPLLNLNEDIEVLKNG